MFEVLLTLGLIEKNFGHSEFEMFGFAKSTIYAITDFTTGKKGKLAFLTRQV